MKISSGIAIIYNNKILLCKPVNSGDGNYSLPKGGVDIGETLIDAAIRETIEEVGIYINESQILNKNTPIVIDYINKKNELFKRVSVFIVRIKSLSEIGISSETLDKSQLQPTEVSFAKFLCKEEADIKIFYRFKPILELLN